MVVFRNNILGLCGYGTIYEFIVVRVFCDKIKSVKCLNKLCVRVVEYYFQY